jgi:H+/Cl- antiporter ClcA
MLRELDFVDSDWDALLWALGSTTALFKHSVPRQLRARLEKCFGLVESATLNNIGKKTVGILWGVAIASGVLTICVQGLLRVAPVLFPEWQSGHAPFLEWLAIVGIPEGVFMTAACALWRKKRSMAAGILLAAMTLITHAIFHAVTHG